MATRPRAVAKPGGTGGEPGKEQPASSIIGSGGGTAIGTGTGTGAGGPGNSPAQTLGNKGSGSRGKKAARATIEVEAQETPLTGEAEGPQPKAKKSRPRIKKSTPESRADAEQAADFLMEMVETFAVAEFGVEGKFNDKERFMIHDPLARLIERYSNLAERYTSLIDPVMVLLGTGMFAIRLGNAYEAQQKRVNALSPQAQQAQTESQQGHDFGSNGSNPYDTTTATPPPGAFLNPNDYFRRPNE